MTKLVVREETAIWALSVCFHFFAQMRRRMVVRMIGQLICSPRIKIEKRRLGCRRSRGDCFALWRAADASVRYSGMAWACGSSRLKPCGQAASGDRSARVSDCVNASAIRSVSASGGAGGSSALSRSLSLSSRECPGPGPGRGSRIGVDALATFAAMESQDVFGQIAGIYGTAAWCGAVDRHHQLQDARALLRRRGLGGRARGSRWVMAQLRGRA